MSKRLRESVLAAKKGRLLRAKAESRSMRPPGVEPIGPSNDPELDDAFGAFQEMPGPAQSAPAAPAPPIEARPAPFVPPPPPKPAAAVHAPAVHAPTPAVHAPAVHAPKPIVAAVKPVAAAPLPAPRPVAHAPAKAPEPKPVVVPPPPRVPEEASPLPFAESASAEVFLSAPITTRPTSGAVPPPAPAGPPSAATFPVTVPPAAPSSAPLPVPLPPSERGPLLKPEDSLAVTPPPAVISEPPKAEPLAPPMKAETAPPSDASAEGLFALPTTSAPSEPAKSDVQGDEAGLMDSFFEGGESEDASLAPTSGYPEPRPRSREGGDDDGESYGEDGLPSFMSPAAEARRARLRRVVGGVVAFVGVIALAVVGKAIFSPSKPTKPTPSAAATAPAAPLDPKPQASADPKPADVKPASTDVKPDASAAPSADPAKPADSATPAASAEPVAPPDSAAADPAKAAALEKETLTLLNRGKRKEAIEKAREAIAADPSQAMPYLYLGSALQDSGQWKQGIEAYSECVRHATKGPVHECRQMGGRK